MPYLQYHIFENQPLLFHMRYFITFTIATFPGISRQLFADRGEKEPRKVENDFAVSPDRIPFGDAAQYLRFEQRPFYIVQRGQVRSQPGAAVPFEQSPV